MAIVVALSAWSPAAAQGSDDPSRQTLGVSLGVIQENRRDDSDSPLAYGGAGPGVRVDYDWNRAAHHWYASFAAGWATVTPTVSSLAAPRPEEDFSSYALVSGMDWRLRGGSARSGQFTLGVQFNATVTVTRHLYAGQDLSEQTFDLGVVTLAPAARWTRQVGSGELVAALAIPLLAWVDHPYADVRFGSQLLEPRFAPLSEFHQANGGLSYAFNPRSRYGVIASYHIDIMELDDLEPVRRAAQSLSIGVVRRFGSPR